MATFSIPAEVMRRPAVYFLKAESGEILYIGCSLSVGTRIDHFVKPRSSPHTHRGDLHDIVDTIEVQNFDTKVAARTAEAALIAEYRPPFNVNHNPGVEHGERLFFRRAEGDPIPEVAPAPAELRKTYLTPPTDGDALTAWLTDDEAA